MARETSSSTERLRKLRRRLLSPVWAGGTALASSVRARTRKLHLSRFERRQRRVVYFAGGLLAVLAAGYAMLFWTPLPLSVVTPRITAALQDRLGPGYAASIGSARLDRGDGGAAVRLEDFEILDPQGRAVLAVPNVIVGLNRSDISILGIGTGAARRVEIEAPRLALRVEEGGGVLLSGGEELALRVPDVSVKDAAARPVAELVATLDALLGPGGALAALESITIRDATVMVDDRRIDWTSELTAIEGSFTRRADGGLTASLVSGDPDQRWSASATLNGAPGAERFLDLGFENISIGRVLENLRPSAGQELEGRLSGHVFAGIDAAGQPSAYELRLDMANVAAGGEGNRIQLDALNLEARWDLANPRFQVRDLRLQTGWGRGRLVFDAQPVDPAAPGGEWAYQLAGRDMALSSPLSNTPIYFSSVSADGHFTLPARRARIDRLLLASPAINIGGSVGLDWSGEKPILDTAISGVRAPVGAILALWPPMLAPRTRAFVANNIRGGMAEDFVLATRGPVVFPPPPPDAPRPRHAVAFDARVSGMEFAPPTTPLSLIQGRGVIRVADDAMRVDLEGGRLTAPGRGVIDIMPSEVTVADMVPREPEVALRLAVKGDAATAGRVLTSLDASTPSTLFDRIGGGTMTGDIRLRGIARQGGRLETLERSVRLDTEDLGIPALVGPLALTKGRLAITIGQDATEVAGEAALGGAPVSIGARARRVEGKLAGTTINLTGDPSRISGFSSSLGGVSGSAAVRLTMPSPGEIEGATVEADLSGTRIDIGPSGATKAVGQPGVLTFSIRKAGSGVVLDQLRLAAAPMFASGRIEFGNDGGLALARFDTLRLTADDDARLDVSLSGDVLKITVRGAALDARPFIRAVRGAAKPSSAAIDIDAKLDRARGLNDENLSDVALTLRRRGGKLQALSLTAGIGQGRLVARLGEGPDRDLIAEAGDAGALLRAFDIYRRVRGGSFELIAPSDGAGLGFLAMRDFAVVGEKALASVASNRSEGPTDRAVVNFSKARVAFAMEEGRLLIRESAVWGPDIGATLDGILDFTVDRMNLTGTFVPAYALNNFFAKIPIIGAILGGGQYEGLLGVTFKVDGPIGSPTVSINPVSAVAPGFLRKLFEFRNQDPALGPQGQAAQ